MDDIDRLAHEWAEVIGVPREELERRQSQIRIWQQRLEYTSEQVLGCDAEEDVRRARVVLAIVKLVAEIIGSALAQPSPTPSPS